MKCSLGISNFLEEISSLSHSIAFLYFFALITEEGFLISPCYSLELCIQMGISFLFSFAFSIPQSPDIFPIPPRLSSQCHLFQEALIACCFGMLGFSGGSVVKNMPANAEMWVQSLGQEDPLEKEMATHSSIAAWDIPWTEELGRL